MTQITVWKPEHGKNKCSNGLTNIFFFLKSRQQLNFIELFMVTSLENQPGNIEDGLLEQKA